MLAAREGAAGGGRVQRYRIETGYSVAGAGGAIVFESQSIAHDPATKAPHYRRTQTTIPAAGVPAGAAPGASGLESHRLGFDPGNGVAAAGHWRAEPGAAITLPHNPAIKVSANGLFAIPADGQARSFYIDAAQVAPLNGQLAARGAAAKLRIRLTGGPTIALPAGAPGAAGPVLHQASIEHTAHPGLAAATLPGRCDELALLVTGRATAAEPPAGLAPGGSGVHASPGVGHAFAFRGGFDERQLDVPVEAAGVEATVGDALARWSELEARLEAGVDAAYASVKNDFAKALLPGWETHFEGVIAIDNADRLTLANYNREEELRLEKRRLFSHLYARLPAFKVAYLRRARERESELHSSGRSLDRLQLWALMDPLLKELRAAITGTWATQALTELERFEKTFRQQQEAMYYFDIYGPAEQSFHHRYQWAGRGAGGTTWAI